MRSGDESGDEDHQPGAASSSAGPMQCVTNDDVQIMDCVADWQVQPFEDEELEERIPSPTEVAPEGSSSRELANCVPLEDVLKGLIISQIRGPHVHVEEGLQNLLKECLISEHPVFNSASLSGYVDHFQSVDDEDLGWGCGWRNIQILCSFLLAEDPESREALFNGAGFVPDIPALQTWLEIAWAKGFDEPGAVYFNWAISGTRKWIGTTECASLLRSFGVRAKIVSFTALGGRQVQTGLAHTFGGSPINLSDGEEDDRTSSGFLDEGMKECPGPTETDNVRGGAIKCTECGKLCLPGINFRGLAKKSSNLCDDCVELGPFKGVAGGGKPREMGEKNQKEAVSDVKIDSETSEAAGAEGSPTPKHNKLLAPNEHHWNLECDGCGNPLQGRRYKSLMKRDFDLCSNCMQEVEEHPTAERGSHTDYVIIEEYPALRNSGPPLQDEQEDDSNVVNGEDGRADRVGWSVDDAKERTSPGGVESEELARKGDLSDRQKHWKREGRNAYDKKEAATSSCSNDRSPEGAVGCKPLANGDRKKAGMQSSAPSPGSDNPDINHHHLIEWVWSYFTEDSARRFAATSNCRHQVTMSKRSPLYFQHRGHSRTIVGIERRKNPTGLAEDVYLLVLDPSVSSELLVKSLRAKSGWQKLIQYDVDTLKETEYQLCYADPGIATGDELEQLKVLSSLRYSYYSK